MAIPKPKLLRVSFLVSHLLLLVGIACDTIPSISLAPTVAGFAPGVWSGLVTHRERVYENDILMGDRTQTISYVEVFDENGFPTFILDGNEPVVGLRLQRPGEASLDSIQITGVSAGDGTLVILYSTESVGADGTTISGNGSWGYGLLDNGQILYIANSSGSGTLLDGARIRIDINANAILSR